MSNKIERICLGCKEPFEPNSKTQKYCSVRCSSQHRKKIWKNSTYKFCAECGNMYLHKAIGHKYCSVECRQKKYKKNQVCNLRWKILLRDNFTCQYCGATVADGIKLHVDHIRPRKENGSNDEENLITSCNMCNYGKGDLLIKEFLNEKRDVKKNNIQTNKGN